MKHHKYLALFLAGAASVVISSESYATSTVDTEMPTFTNETELVNYIIHNMENLEDGFEARFVGDVKGLIGNYKLGQLIRDAQNENDYLVGIGASIDYDASYTRKEAELKFTTKYVITKEQQNFVDAEVERINAQIIRQNMTDLEKVLAISEYIIKNTTYSFDSSTTPHASYALFKEGKGVCQAYAMAAYHMFKAAGLDTHYVTGDIGVGHAWNLVKVNGEWYHIDLTWNDPRFDGNNLGLEDYISYKYFLLSDDTILAERIMDSRPNLPKATAKNFEVFRSIESIPYVINGTQYMLLPEFVNNQVFYVNYSNDFAINTLNLSTEPLVIERFADVRAMDILVTNDAIYFVNIDTNFGLSKIDLQTKAVTDLYSVANLYSKDSVTSIKLENGVVNAYHNETVVYSENITENETTKTPVDKELETATDVIDQIKDTLKDVLTTEDVDVSQIEEILVAQPVVSGFSGNETENRVVAQLTKALEGRFDGQFSVYVTNYNSEYSMVDELLQNNLIITYQVDEDTSLYILQNGKINKYGE